MGGGRDFLGRRIYRKVDGKYERIIANKTGLLDAVKKAENEEQLTKALIDVGLDGKIDFMKSDKLDFETKRNFGVGLSKMASEYGTDVFNGVRSVHLNYDVAGRSHINEWDSDYGIIEVNDRLYAPGHDRQWIYEDKYGSHPENNNDEMMIEHEYAHLLQRKLAEHSSLVKKQIEKRNEWDAELEKLDKQLNGAAKKYIALQDKLDVTRYSKVKTRQKLEQQMYDLQQNVIKKMGIEVIPDLKKLRDLAAERMSTQFIDYEDGGVEMIRNIFRSVGAKTTYDVAIRLTGSTSAYAGKNWMEAHAECVSDYMNNGKNASPISIAYVRKMNKYIKK